MESASAVRTYRLRNKTGENEVGQDRDGVMDEGRGGEGETAEEEHDYLQLIGYGKGVIRWRLR